ncbi:SHOCT domain-containing protein [Haloquadratum walsbyi]|jgi:Predicted membrane protein (DUF2078).|uniref:Putative membrane protein (DUF2078) n=1 Tax=Haloquadratum walsbyi J07HQW2 TaxID=1238425 RepID=U1NBA6_9EURY|nr:SHOCT domain-containing protein [Haloquadratum walsbyi]ERG93893.1 MAG: putative membrane protein (DUF2078) [Haloquadratum walsbyi J07HQW2]
MSDLLSKSLRLQAVAASISAILGVGLIYKFLRTPQYTQIPDPRIIPINGLLWLSLGIIAVSISAYLIYTLNRQSEAANADPGDSEEHSSSTPTETLHKRYATGEISHTEFERHLERLLETKDISQIDRSMSLLKYNGSTSHLDTDSSSGLTEEESY